MSEKQYEINFRDLVNILKPVSNDVLFGRGKLCLTTFYLEKLNSVINGHSSNNASFSNDVDDMVMLKDIQFLRELVEGAIALKITSDRLKELCTANIYKFRNVRVLEIHKLHVKYIKGIENLRKQLRQLTCYDSLETMEDILAYCGDSNCEDLVWNELWKVSFVNNGITTMNCLQYVPRITNLDLSHNKLNNIYDINILCNLEKLDVSFNRLEYFPKFSDQLCNKLQVLIMNNNLIKDLYGLSTLVNIRYLDISHNFLNNHDLLQPISNLCLLESLNLQGNPLYLHSQHRIVTCRYLHKCVLSYYFLLDNVPLSSQEKKVINDCEIRKNTRNVVIQDFEKEKKPTKLSSSNIYHLTIKKQVEQLRKQFGVSWLHCDGGLQEVQNILGYDEPLLSSTAIDISCSTGLESDVSLTSKLSDSQVFLTAKSKLLLEDSNDFDTSALSDGDDLCFAGDKCIYLANLEAGNGQVFVVVTDTHISERNVTTSKEIARWHVNTIISCEKLSNTGTAIQLVFDTLRRDRKQRIYELDNADDFCYNIQQKIAIAQKEVKYIVSYQCIKCSNCFNRYKGASKDLTCPKCKSNLIIKSV